MKAVHRHTQPPGHEHEYEPQLGLPEVLPEGEKQLWQGSPRWQALALEVFHVRKLAIYFGLILLARAGFVLAEGGGAADVFKSWALLGPVSAVTVGIMLVLAQLAARTAVYTITSRRVIMRIGIVLTVSYNLPFKRIESAGLMLRGHDGHGDIPITLHKGEQIAILQLWPHARPWHVARPQPMLRGLANAADVGLILSKAWQTAQASHAETTPMHAPATVRTPEPRAAELADAMPSLMPVRRAA